MPGILEYFVRDFDTIFLINSDTYEVKMLHSVSRIKDWVNIHVKTGFEQFRKDYADAFVSLDDKDIFLKISSIEYIKERLKNTPVFYFDHKIKIGDQNIYYQVKFIRVDGTNTIIFGGRNINDSKRSEIQNIINTHNTQNNVVVASLSGDFDFVIYVNILTKELKTYHISSLFRNLYDSIKDDISQLKKYEKVLFDLVCEEDREKFIKENNLEYIQNELVSSSSYETYFRIQLNGQLFYYKLKYSQDPNDVTCLIVSLKSFDQEARTEIRHKEERLNRNLMEKQIKIMLSDRTQEIIEKNKVLNQINEEIVELLGDLTEARDLESGEHIRRVKGYTYIIANQLMNDYPEYNLTNEKINLITTASALHDIGKIMIPDSILLKPGKLTAEEFEIMKTHTEKGLQLLDRAPKGWSQAYLNTSMEIILHHHEKFDGKGYPKALVGDDIPISAQIVSLADCFDALTTKRVYKDAFDYETAINMIINGECGCFSPKLIDVLEKCKPTLIRELMAPEKTFFSSGYVYDKAEKLLHKKILFAGNDEMERMILRQMVEGEGGTVIEANSYRDAVDVFKMMSVNTFDVIICNLKLLQEQGYKYIKEIRDLNTDYAKNIPIIGLGDYENSTVKGAAFETGITDILIKPIGISQLVNVITRYSKK